MYYYFVFFWGGLGFSPSRQICLMRCGVLFADCLFARSPTCLFADVPQLEWLDAEHRRAGSGGRQTGRQADSESTITTITSSNSSNNSNSSNSSNSSNRSSSFVSFTFGCLFVCFLIVFYGPELFKRVRETGRIISCKFHPDPTVCNRVMTKTDRQASRQRKRPADREADRQTGRLAGSRQTDMVQMDNAYGQEFVKQYTLVDKQTRIDYVGWSLLT